MNTCVLCDTLLDDDTVEFGVFAAHRGCANDWQRDFIEQEADRFDILEAQEW